MDDNTTPRYDTGADFWRDTAASYGLDEALVICGNYFNTQLGHELSREEKQFCRELFAAMFEATAGRTDLAKLIYPYPVQEAKTSAVESLYYEGLRRNIDCAHAIDEAVKNSYYKLYHYNVNIAAMSVIHQYGFPRVNAVMARVVHRSEWDGRYSYSNKQWAREFPLPDKAFERVYLNEHPALLDSFVSSIRELYAELNAERFALPGQPESGEVLEGYEIKRTITFDDQRGFAIAEHPRAGHVCWMFRTDRGGRDYYWGHYCENEQDAAANYVARVMEHMSGGAREEPQLVIPSAPAPEPPPRKPKDRGDR